MFEPMTFTPTLQKSLRRILEFYRDDEYRHFMESDEPAENHIYLDISFLLTRLDAHEASHDRD